MTQTINGTLDFNVHSLGDSAIIVHFGDEIDIAIHNKIKTLTSFLDKHPIHGMIEYVPSYTSVTIYYDPIEVLKNNTKGNHSPYQLISWQLNEIIKTLKKSNESIARKMDIPVCYGGDFGPDLEFVARHHHLTNDEVIKIHSSQQYLVYMIGFAPGFPFIGGMSEQIATPRREKPRIEIPAGSVGIAGNQTGVYPISTPGGWQIIARTPLKLFIPEQNPPSLLQAGDIVTFTPISFEEFTKIQEEA